jgi:hypothetical protein
MYFLPYMLFSTQAPKASTTLPPSSEPSGKHRPYLALNLSWLVRLSLETPTTSTPSSWKRG